MIRGMILSDMSRILLDKEKVGTLWDRNRVGILLARTRVRILLEERYE